MRLTVRQGSFFLFGPKPDLRQHQLRTISYDSYATQLTFHWKHDPSSDWKSSTLVKWKNKSIRLFFKEGHCWRIGNHKCSPSGSNITWLWLRSCLMVGAQVAAKNYHRVFRIRQKTYQTPETSNARQPNALKGHLMTTNALIDHKRSSKPTRLTALLPNRRISSLTTASTSNRCRSWCRSEH